MKKRIVLSLLLFGGILMLFAVYSYSPHEAYWYPPCLFKKITGLDCPGCGGTRACYQLLHGNIPAAANYNLLLIVMIPVTFIGVAVLINKRLRFAWEYFNKPMAILTVVLLFWVFRNLPFSPFDWLHSDK